MMYHIGAELLFGGAALLAVVSILKSISGKIDDIIAALEGDDGGMNRPGAFAEDQAPAADDVVMCGGCGKSFPLIDGFNPVPHDCDGIDNALLAK